MQLDEIVRLALSEDVGPGDVTTLATVAADATAVAAVRAKQDLVVCGQACAAEVFRQVGADYQIIHDDGTHVSAGTVIGRSSGPARSLLTGERLALNFLMKLCGIATHTRDTVRAAQGKVKVVDTRKTTPLLRALERRAVQVGGGANHRHALYDGVLIKDNHVAAAGGVAQAVAGARAHAHHLLAVEVEVGDLDQLAQALDAGVDAVLLDNMDDATLAQAVALTRARPGGDRIVLEASGNMTAARIGRIKDLGLDVISMGGLIHQATWVDLSMKFESGTGVVH